MRFSTMKRGSIVEKGAEKSMDLIDLDVRKPALVSILERREELGI
jgi:hypothetical protein